MIKNQFFFSFTLILLVLFLFNEFSISIILNNKIIPFDLRVILFLFDAILTGLLFYLIIKKNSIKYPAIIKILFTNFCLLIFFILIIEITFGEWWFKNNLNKLNLIKNKEYKINLNGLYDFEKNYIIYKRDNFGFRGEYPEVSRINILTVGGSTTDQRYISEGYTFQDIIQKKFLEQGKKIFITNAGIDGQSTFGHLKNFDLWFSQIPNLQPDYFLFFIGINDFYIDIESSYDEIALAKKNHNMISLINFYYKQYSALHYLMRTFEGNINSYKYNLRHEASSKNSFQKIKWTNKGISNNYDVLLKNKLFKYKDRLEKIIQKTKEYNSKIIFVSQSERRKYYFDNGQLFGNSEKVSLNDTLINGVDYYYMNRMYIETMKKLSQEKKIIFIDLEKELNFDIQQDFYDNSHFNNLGAKKIGEYLFSRLRTLY